jgi:mannosyl-oligosaccharide alpha-1,2-mannosidase
MFVTSLPSAAAILFAITTTSATATSNISSQSRADAVKATFHRAWDGYYEFAFPHDQLQPLNNTYNDN